MFINQGTLFAAPLDLKRMQLTASPVAVVEGVRSSRGGGAQFSVSDTGTLVYVAGEHVQDFPVHWLDRDGTVTLLREEPVDWGNPRFSPDGDRLAMTISDGEQWDIWAHDWRRGIPTLLTLDPADDVVPAWAPDGRHLVFSSSRGEGVMLYWPPSDGGGAPIRLTESERGRWAQSWHPSGDFLTFVESSPETGWDLKVLEMKWDEASGWTPGASFPFVDDPLTQRFGSDLVFSAWVLRRVSRSWYAAGIVRGPRIPRQRGHGCRLPGS